MNSLVNIDGLSNSYGEVFAIEEDGKYYLGLGDYSGCAYVEISKELFEQLNKEFNG